MFCPASLRWEAYWTLLQPKGVSTPPLIVYTVNAPGSPLGPPRFAALRGKFLKAAGEFKPGNSPGTGAAAPTSVGGHEPLDRTADGKKVRGAEVGVLAWVGGVACASRPALRPGSGRLCGRISTDTSKFCSTDRPWCPRSNPSMLVRPSNARVPAVILSHARPRIFACCQAVGFKPHNYVVRSSFSIIFLLHIMYLGLVTGQLVKDDLNGLSLAIKRDTAGNSTEPEDTKFSWPRFATVVRFWFSALSHS